MPLDGIAIRCMARELDQKLRNARTDKIYQPERDELHLTFRGREDNLRLVLSASANNARAHLSQNKKNNPATAPQFCMLLRKHLIPSRVQNVQQVDFERVLRINFSTVTEMGDPVEKSLLVELMGRHSNIILVDHTGKILDSIKHIDMSVSRLRQVMPGLLYQNVPAQDKHNPLEVTPEQFSALLSACPSSERLHKWLLSAFGGLSPMACREIVYRAFWETDTQAADLTGEKHPRFVAAAMEFFMQIRNGSFDSVLIEGDERWQDFAAFWPRQYEQRVRPAGTLSEALEQFYTDRDTDERHRQRTAALSKTLHILLERCAKKIAIYQDTLDDAAQKEQKKRWGDLIMANIYAIKPGDTVLSCYDFYEESQPLTDILLDPNKTPAQNAQQYYAEYTKQKTAERMAQTRLEQSQAELAYLASVEQSLTTAQTPAELSQIRSELHEQGYLAHNPGPQRKRAAKPEISPLHFVSSDGFDIFVGKNNLQNDYITFKLSRSEDMWLHAKNIPGSHALIRRGQADKIPDQTMLEAAILAAYHSKLKNGVKVPVDYTPIKNVKKIARAQPGMVIYDHFQTLLVTPDADTVARLQK